MVFYCVSTFKRRLFLILFLLIFLVPSSISYAENETEFSEELIESNETQMPVAFSDNNEIGENQNNNFQLSLILPKTLIGYNLILQDEQGNINFESVVDSTGICEVPINKQLNKTSILINSNQIVSSGKKEAHSSFSVRDIVLINIITISITFAIAFIIGRRSCLKVLKELRDYIYEENYD